MLLLSIINNRISTIATYFFETILTINTEANILVIEFYLYSTKKKKKK